MEYTWSRVTTKSDSVMTTELLTLCDYASFELSGMTIIGAKDSILCDRMPFALDLPHVAARIRFESHEDGEKEVEFAVISPDGRPTMDTFRWRAMFASNGRLFASMPFALRLPPIVFREYGQFQLELRVDEYRSAVGVHVMHGGLPRL